MIDRKAINRAVDIATVGDLTPEGVSAAVDALLDELISRVPSWSGRISERTVEDWLRDLRNGMR